MRVRFVGELVASLDRGESTGLVFGLNTWAALGLQTALTLTVADAAGLALPVRTQFVVYAALFWVAGLAFAAYFVYKSCASNKKRPSPYLGDKV